jgi:hypothetical protein
VIEPAITAVDYPPISTKLFFFLFPLFLPHPNIPQCPTHPNYQDNVASATNNATDPIRPNTGLFIWIGSFAQSTKIRQVGIGLEKQSNTHVLDCLTQSIIIQKSVLDWKTNPIHNTVSLVLAIMYQVLSSLTLFFPPSRIEPMTCA